MAESIGKVAVDVEFPDSIQRQIALQLALEFVRHSQAYGASEEQTEKTLKIAQKFHDFLTEPKSGEVGSVGYGPSTVNNTYNGGGSPVFVAEGGKPETIYSMDVFNIDNIDLEALIDKVESALNKKLNPNGMTNAKSATLNEFYDSLSIVDRVDLSSFAANLRYNDWSYARGEKPVAQAFFRSFWNSKKQS